MRYLFIYLILVLSSIQGQSQQKLDVAIPDLVDQDHMGNYYLVYEDEVIQYDQLNRELNRFSNKNYGKISEIDASNALKILLHYRELTSIAFLDNRLGERSDLLDLQEAGLAQSHLSCSSYNNGVWVYDKVDLSLYRLDQNLKPSLRSGNLNQITGKTLDPVEIRESGRWLYVLHQNKGIVVCDIYGAYSKFIPVDGIIDLEVLGEELLILDEEGIKRYNEISLSFDQVLLRKGIKHFSAGGRKILFVDDDALWVTELPK